MAVAVDAWRSTVAKLALPADVAASVALPTEICQVSVSVALVYGARVVGDTALMLGVRALDRVYVAVAEGFGRPVAGPLLVIVIVVAVVALLDEPL